MDNVTLTLKRVQHYGTTVICDTTVWYDRIPEHVKNNHTLAATCLSVFELFKTSEQRPGVIINTWERLRDNARFVIPMTPDQQFYYYRTKGQVVIQADVVESFEATLIWFDAIIRGKKNGEVSADNWAIFMSEIDKLRSSYSKAFEPLVAFMNARSRDLSITQATRNFLKSPAGLDYFLVNVSFPLLASVFSGVYQLTIDDLAPFELFNAVFSSWLIEIQLGKCTPVVNDLIDLFNMLYVTTGDKYWTAEKKWIRKINELGLGHYLFDAA